MGMVTIPPIYGESGDGENGIVLPTSLTLRKPWNINHPLKPMEKSPNFKPMIPMKNHHDRWWSNLQSGLHFKPSHTWWFIPRIVSGLVHPSYKWTLPHLSHWNHQGRFTHLRGMNHQVGDATTRPGPCTPTAATFGTTSRTMARPSMAKVIKNHSVDGRGWMISCK